jgi:hypothetical protein
MSRPDGMDHALEGKRAGAVGEAAVRGVDDGVDRLA